MQSQNRIQRQSKGKIGRTHIPKVPIQHLNITMDNLKCDELVISRANPSDEEQRRIAAVHDFRVCPFRRVGNVCDYGIHGIDNKQFGFAMGLALGSR